MLRAGDLVGRYRIEGLLGAGGMGEVYRAYDPQLARSVALKRILSPSQDDRPQWVLRMLREARAAAAFNHPNAVAIYDVGEHDGLPFLVMELVVGKSLRAYVGASLPDWQTRLRWMVDVARALGAAHAAGLVHRDMKPDNVMVRDDGAIKVLDFGIARSAHDPANLEVVDPTGATQAPHLGTITQDGSSVGTPAYMAPEQIQGDTLDGRADQFAWAVSAFELLCGTPPWGNVRDGMKLVAAVLTRSPESLRARRPDLPQALEAVLGRALAKAPSDRFASMEAVVAAILPLLDGASSASVAAAASASIPGGSVPSQSAAPKGVDSAVGVTRTRPTPPQKPWLHPAAVAATVLGVAALAFLVKSRNGIRTTPRPPEDTALRGRHPCKAPGSCSDGATAWCDADEKDLACCARGLVAVGRDGMCECAPGGATVDVGGCPRATLTRAQWDSAVDPFGPSFFACLRANDAASAYGEVKVDAWYDPEGVVYEARIANGALPEVSAQRCVLDAVRATKGPRPPDGSMHSELDFDLEPAKKN